MFSILKNRNFILPFAFIAGLSFPGFAQYSKSLTIPALALVMTVSLSDIPTKKLLQWKQLSRPTLLGILFNYGILSTLILLFTFIFITDSSLRTGMVLVAASPPGAAVIPFTILLSGDTLFSLFSMFGTYVAAIIFAPLLTLWLSGAEHFPFAGLVQNLLYLVFLPIILSRFLNNQTVSPFLKKWRGTIVNWGFFVVIFTVTGLNQEGFFHDLNHLFKIIMITFFTTIPLFLLLQKILKKLKINQKEVIPLILLGTIKNSGFAAALAISLFDIESSIPGAIISVGYALYMIWLGKR